MDFGIAKAVSGSKLSATGTLVGTLPYMAPEQWLGEPAAFSHDIWAVGCVLYQLLSGTLARSYQTPGEYVAAAARHDRVAPLPGGVPAWLADAVYLLLEPDPRQRPTASQCVELLNRPAAPPPAPRSPTQVSRPAAPGQPTLPAQAASWQTTQPAQPVPARQPAAGAVARPGPISQATADRVLDAAQRSAAFSPPATTGGRPPAATGDRSRRWFLIAAGGTGLAAAGATTAWKLLDGASPGPKGTGSGSASGSGSGSASGVLLSRLSASTSVNSVAFSPNGRVLADGSGGNGGEGTVQLWNIADPAHPVALGQPLTGLTYVNALAFSPDGRTLAAGTGPGTIQLWNVANPAHPVALGKPLTAPAQVVSVAFSPSGQILASGSASGGPVTGAIRLWNVANPARPAALGYPASAGEYEVNSLAFSPNGHTLASANASIPALVQLWNVTVPAHVVLLGQAVVSNGVRCVAFSPDGHTLASAGGDVNSGGGASSSAIQLWNVTDPAHPAALGQPLAGPATPFNSVAFSPSGRTLAAGSGSPTLTAGAIQLWNVTDVTRPAALGSPLNDGSSAIAAVAFSPDGRVLAGGNGDSVVDLWSVG
jgi:WD40 repeat protein